MKKPYLINLFYSVFVMVIGLVGFILSYPGVSDFQFTVPFLFGTVLLFLNKGIRQQNKVISHIAVLLTFVLAILTLIMIINIGGGFLMSDKGILFSLVILSSFTVLTLYIIRFIVISKNKP